MANSASVRYLHPAGPEPLEGEGPSEDPPIYRLLDYTMAWAPLGSCLDI